MNIFAPNEAIERSSELSDKLIVVRGSAAYFYRDQVWLRSYPNDDDPSHCILLAPDDPKCIKHIIPFRFGDTESVRIPESAFSTSLTVAGILKRCIVAGFNFALEQLQWTEEFFAERRRPQLAWVNGKYRESTDLPYRIEEAYFKYTSLLATHPSLAPAVTIAKVIESKEEFFGRNVKLSGFLIARDSDRGRGPSLLVEQIEDMNNDERCIEVDRPSVLAETRHISHVIGAPDVGPDAVVPTVISGVLKQSPAFAATLSDVTELCISGSLNRRHYRCVRGSRA
jgi:hypothetical protein